MLQVPVDYYKLCEAAIRNGALTANEALDRDVVTAVAARMIEEVVWSWI